MPVDVVCGEQTTLGVEPSCPPAEEAKKVAPAKKGKKLFFDGGKRKYIEGGGHKNMSAIELGDYETSHAKDMRGDWPGLPALALLCPEGGGEGRTRQRRSVFVFRSN